MRTPPTPLLGISRFVEAEGQRLHFLQHGEAGAPALVIVPGITSPAATWEFVAEELARDFHVLTLDVRGRGLSDSGADHTLPAYARDLEIALPALGLERPALLGHSAGARIVAAFAAYHPKLAGSVIVCDPPLSGPGRPPYPTPVEAFLESIRLAKAGATAEDMRPYFPTWTDEQLALRAAWLPTCDPQAIAKVHRGFQEEDFFFYWRELAPPLLFLWGGQSPVVTADSAAEVADANPAARVIELPKAGHMLPWDDLDGFLAAVRRFLTEEE